MSHLLLPQPAALNGIGSVPLPRADVQVSRVDARRVVAAVAGILNPCLLPDERGSAQVPEKPSMRSVLLVSGVEDSVSALIPTAIPEPAFAVSSTVHLGPELGDYFEFRHAIHSTPRAISSGVN
ncbi:hypothetical protein [Streptomyces antibioticus]|uniref:hypothetical protein n=1 Tax=Streptomyces antibioticus TaxID=1890 RepID=UPI0036F9CD7C